MDLHAVRYPVSTAAPKRTALTVLHDDEVVLLRDRVDLQPPLETERRPRRVLAAPAGANTNERLCADTTGPKHGLARTE